MTTPNREQLIAWYEEYQYIIPDYQKVEITHSKPPHEQGTMQLRSVYNSYNNNF